MNRYDYFIQSMKAKAHYDRDWMLRAMNVVFNEPRKVVPYSLKHTDSAVLVYVPNSTGEYDWQTLEGAVPYEIPYIYHEIIDHSVKAFDVENLSYDLEGCTWGDLIFNSRVLVYSCGDRIEFMKGPIDLGKLDNILAKRLKDDPLDGQEVPGEIYTYHLKAYGKAVGDLAGYESVIPSVTEKSLQPPPNRDELRDQLFKENEGQLKDPVVQAKIQKALVDAYLEQQLQGDPAEGFIYSKKSINTAIKRMFLIHGPENGFGGGEADFIKTSLQEGLDITKWPVMINSLRAGSYYRGALTALAGEDVDLMGRSFQNVRIADGFCGTEEGLQDTIGRQHLGRYILVGGENIHINDESFSKYEGTLQEVLSPLYCITGHGDYCEYCVGTRISPYKTSMGSMVAEVPSTMMGAMMGSAHAKELKTTGIDMKTFLE